MIKSKTVFSLSPLAIALERKGVNTLKMTSPWVHGMVGVTNGPVPYSRENLPDLIEKDTDLESDHAFLQGTTAALIADQVKESFGYIRQYLRPFHDKLVNAIHGEIDVNPEDILFDRHTPRFYDLWHEFLDHPLFPSTTPNEVYDYRRFDLKPFFKVSNVLPYYNEQTFIEKMEIPELGEMSAFIDLSDLREAWDRLRDINALCWMYDEVEKDGVNATTGKALYKDWIALHVLLSHLIIREVPLEDVKGVSLTEYETFLYGIHNLVIFTLQSIKERHSILVGKKLDVSFDKKSEANFPGNTESVSSRKFPQIKVGLTKEGLAFVDTKEGTLSEAVIGYGLTWADNNEGSKGQPNLIDGWDIYIERFKKESKTVLDKFSTELQVKIKKVIDQQFCDFQKTHKDFETFFLSLNSEPEFFRLAKHMETFTYAEVQRIKGCVTNGRTDLDDYLATSYLTVSLARVLGFHLAADILEGAVTTGRKSLEERRIALGKSVVRAMTRLAFKPE